MSITASSLLYLHLFLPVDSLGPAQLAVEALDDGFIASVLDLRGFDDFLLGVKQELKLTLWCYCI